MTGFGLRAGVLLTAAVAVATSVATAAAPQVSGKLLLGAYKPAPAAPAESKRPSYNWELENGFKEVRPDRVDARRELAVVLLGEGEPAAESRLEVTFSGGGLMPSTVVVRTGATMLIRNDDEIAHELFAQGLEGFSAEATSPRGRRSVNCKTAGSWPLHDRLVTHVTGQLHVLPDLIAVANVSADGEFTFNTVAPGKYTLKVFHGDKELASQEVEVTSRPLTVNPIALGVGPESK
jgi:hypothetical protein